jgi:hypothetical protein
MRVAVWPGLLIVVMAALPRLASAVRQDLWADELFSLAVATGHSLEHPAAAAVPALGDFVEPPAAVPAAYFQQYLMHDVSPAGFDRVLRAVLLSDTSPPLYYLVLNVWTRLAGTGDAALHLLSVAWSLGTLPWIWLLGRRVGGPRVAWFATTLFALAPLSLYYSVEGRMYSMVWCLSAMMVWLSIQLRERGAGARALWVLVAAAGLLTHYFFVFVWAACLGWLLLRTGRATRRQVVAAVAIVLLLAAPWYRLVPGSLAQWRVTAHWLDGRPPLPRLLAAPITLGWGYLSGRGVWGGLEGADIVIAVVMLAAATAWLRRDRASVVAGERGLLWLWALAACIGPVVFDLLRDSSTSLITRYALAGLPGALLLVALALAALPRRTGLVGLALMVLAWAPGIWVNGRRGPRSWEPYRRVAAELRRSALPGDVVLVHAIPSGVLGIARYLDQDTPMASWVGQLGNRQVPADVAALLDGHQRVAFVRIHDVSEPAPEEAWLRAHATIVTESERAGAPITYFARPSTRR